MELCSPKLQKQRKEPTLKKFLILKKIPDFVMTAAAADDDDELFWWHG